MKMQWKKIVDPGSGSKQHRRRRQSPSLPVASACYKARSFSRIVRTDTAVAPQTRVRCFSKLLAALHAEKAAPAQLPELNSHLQHTVQHHLTGHGVRTCPDGSSTWRLLGRLQRSSPPHAASSGHPRCHAFFVGGRLAALTRGSPRLPQSYGADDSQASALSRHLCPRPVDIRESHPPRSAVRH